MQISLRPSNRDLTPAESAYIERRLGFALGRLQSEVHRVHVFLQDVNGPRGGADLRCRMVACLCGQELVVEDQDANFEDLIDRTAERLGQRVARTLDRRREHRRTRLGLGEVIWRRQNVPSFSKGDLW